MVNFHNLEPTEYNLMNMQRFTDLLGDRFMSLFTQRTDTMGDFDNAAWVTQAVSQILC